MDDDELLPFNEAWVLLANMEVDATGDAEFSALAARSVDKGRGSITVLLHSYLLRSRWRPNALYSTRVLVSTVALRAARPLAPLAVCLRSWVWVAVCAFWYQFGLRTSRSVQSGLARSPRSYLYGPRSNARGIVFGWSSTPLRKG